MVENQSSALGRAQVIDNFSSINVNTPKGSRPAFTNISATYTFTGSTGSQVTEPILDKDNLNTTLSLAGGSKVYFTVTCTVMQDAIGPIDNYALVDGQRIDQPSIMPRNYITFKKWAITPNYPAGIGGDVQFGITLGNNSEGPVNDLVLTDAIQAIKAVSFEGDEIQAFTSWNVKISQTEGVSSVVDNDSGAKFEPIENEDLAVRVSLEKNASVTFTVTGTVSKDASGNFINRTLVTSSNALLAIAEATISPYPVKIQISKQSVGNEYSPGGDLSFTVAILNDGKSLIYREVLKDDIGVTQVILADGDTGSAFAAETGSFAELEIPATSTSTKIDAMTYEVTIPPGDTVTYTAKGRVVNNAVGGIINTAVFQGCEISSNTVSRAKPYVIGEFRVEQKYYTPGATLEYHLKFTNASIYPVFDLQIESQFTQSIGQYVTGISAHSFDSGTITASTDGGKDSDAGDFEDNLDINTAVSISGLGFVEYVIKPVVDKDMASPIDVNAYYNFTFAASVWSDSSGSGLITVKPDKDKNATHLSVLNVLPVSGNIKTAKIANKDSYDTEEKVIYTLTAVNSGESNMLNVHLTDDLLNLVSATSGKPVFTGCTFTAYETINGVETRPQL